jgi:bifunctional pyridoxal-dependent enzyme with beta-cystathionase and maltose regulon repressor activities
MKDVDVPDRIDADAEHQRYIQEHFTEPVAPSPEERDTIPDSAWLQIRSPKAAEKILNHVVPERSGYYSYLKGDKKDQGLPRLGHQSTRTRISKLLPFIKPPEGRDVSEAELRQSYIDWLKQEHNIDIEPDSIVFCDGIYNAIHEVWKTHEPEKKKHMGVITPFYDKMMNHLEADMGYAKLNEKGEVIERSGSFSHLGLIDTEEGWKFDVDAFEQGLDKAEPQLSCLLLCSPNNPTGYVFSEKDLKTIINACRQRNILIISDEAWADLVTNPEKKHVPTIKIAQEMGYADGVVMQYNPCKAFNTSAFPCTMLAIPDPKLRARIKERQQTKKEGLHLPSQLAVDVTVACFRDGKEHLGHLKRFLRENLTIAEEALKQAGYDVHMPDATYLLNPYIGDSHDQVADSLERYGIKSRNKGKESGAEGYIRLTTGVPREVLERHYEEWVESR